jgi:hypothetical protein
MVRFQLDHLFRTVCGDAERLRSDRRRQWRADARSTAISTVLARGSVVHWWRGPANGAGARRRSIHGNRRRRCRASNSGADCCGTVARARRPRVAMADRRRCGVLRRAGVLARRAERCVQAASAGVFARHLARAVRRLCLFIVSISSLKHQPITITIITITTIIII